jgi:hypothetical protein
MPVYLIDKIQQKNDGEFFLMDAKDIECKDGTSLQDKLDALAEGGIGGGSGGGDIPDSGYDFVAEFESALGTVTQEASEH